jgi:exosortase/archaeosortase family protein
MTTSQEFLGAPAQHEPKAEAKVLANRLVRVIRFLGGLVVFTAGLGLIYAQAGVRGAEAATSGWLVNSGYLGLDPAITFGPTVYMLLGSSRVMGFTITAECTAAFLIAPLLLIAGGMMAFHRRVSSVRILGAALAAASTLYVANQLRVLVIAYFVKLWGSDDGYQISHRVVGSILMLCALCVTYGAFLLFTCRRERHLSTPER